MAMEKVTGIRVDAVTGKQEVYEYEREVVNPRKFEIEQRLQQIVGKLQLTDYQSHKFADGDLTDAEYDPIRKERKALRAEYNQLEEELKALT